MQEPAGLPDREAVDALTPTLDHIVIDRGAEVELDARAIQVLRQRVPVVAFVNNHYAGYAPETVRQLADGRPSWRSASASSCARSGAAAGLGRARAQAVLMSVWRTCWQQGRSALDFLSLLLRGAPVALALPP